MCTPTAKLLAIGLSWWVCGIGVELAAQTLQGTLLLRNGEVLKGRATRAGDRFTVELDSGGQLRIPVADVEFFGHDLDQVYRHRLARIEPHDVEQYLELARWCLAQELLEQSARCLLVVSRLDPDHRDLDRTERRLLEAARPRQRASGTKLASDQGQRPGDSPALVELPGPVVAEFARRIQPILLNGCAAAACHRRPTQAEYRLHIPPRNRPMPRDLTLRNLRATLAWVDSDEIDECQLLQQARTPHGAPGHVRLPTLDRRQYSSLVAWTRQAAGSPDPADPAVARASYDAELPEDSTDSADRSETRPGQDNRQANDPFDPEVFNRRFLQPPLPDSAGQDGGQPVEPEPTEDDSRPLTESAAEGLQHGQVLVPDRADP
jgi:hypothetical protein